MATAARPIEVPPLENGDRLTRAEFERRYAAMPWLKKAELVEGVVHVMSSPVSNQGHAAPHFRLVGWLNRYCDATPGVQGGDNATLRLDLDNEPQPDAYLRIVPEAGGQSRDDEDDYVRGAPELVAEVASSSASYDLHSKLGAYRRNGVCDYLVWRVRDRALDWFVLREGRYDRLLADPDGIMRSGVFPGLWLDAAALLSGDAGHVAEVAQKGLASPEHAAFVEGLRRALDRS